MTTCMQTPPINGGVMLFFQRMSSSKVSAVMPFKTTSSSGGRALGKGRRQSVRPAKTIKCRRKKIYGMEYEYHPHDDDGSPDGSEGGGRLVRIRLRGRILQ
eukprot:scaffold46761_cov176-Amphora_coffeaeformis.AAC.1